MRPEAKRFMDMLPPEQRYTFIVGYHVGQGLGLPAAEKLRELRIRLGLEKPPRATVVPASPRARKLVPIELLPTLVCEDCGGIIPRPPERRRGRPPRKCAACKARA